MKKIIIISVSVFALVVLTGFLYTTYNAVIMVEGGAVESHTHWEDEIVIDGETVQVRMTFHTRFEMDGWTKLIELKTAEYEHWASDGNSEIYFKDMDITSDYTQGLLFFPDKYTVELSFTCNGKPIVMGDYYKSNNSSRPYVLE
ncbi:MAG: hypothetical protein FWH14_02045 [Oscillospiraceae bacterium]|nr:hypothetical protein [Oscillospiraceae bacterium]